jgi:hypothetical protein
MDWLTEKLVNFPSKHFGGGGIYKCCFALTIHAINPFAR